MASYAGTFYPRVNEQSYGVGQDHSLWDGCSLYMEKGAARVHYRYFGRGNFSCYIPCIDRN